MSSADAWSTSSTPHFSILLAYLLPALSSRGREKLVDDLNFSYATQKKNADGTKQYWRCEVTTRAGYVIPEEYTKSQSGEMFLQHDSGTEDENRILVFASAQGLRDLVRYKSWGFNGTFNCCPKVFAQLLTIHGQRRNI
ncbi:hypothetical protein O3P69_007902 [Scylla paramamosain]|uniref:Uncharacterized protein n=1 Tax=Scylla paramamosain TaxID=85552 RepID=A0AAW0T2Y0_SCYPA